MSRALVTRLYIGTGASPTPTPTPHASFTDSHSSCDLSYHPPFHSDTELLSAVADPKVIHSSPCPPLCTLSFTELSPNPKFLCYLGNPDCCLLFPLFSHQVISDSLWPHGLQHTRFPCPSLPPGVCSNSCPLSLWCYPTISTSVAPSSCCPQSLQHQGLFQWVSSLHQVAEVLELQFQHQSFQWIFQIDFLQDWLIWSPCCLRDYQESSPAPQFESINSLALSLLYGPDLTSIHDYWKKHSSDYTDVCEQSGVSTF